MRTIVREQFPGIGSLALLVVLLFGPSLLAAPPLTAPDGDLNRDGNVDAMDIQCMVLTYTQVELAGNVAADKCADDPDCVAQFGANYYCRPGFTEHDICLPKCLDQTVVLGSALAPTCDDPNANTEQCLGIVPKHKADLNCDDLITNADMVLMVGLATGKMGGPDTGDYDEDNLLNFCDDDSDADEILDEIDCEPLDPELGACDDGSSCTDDGCAEDGSCWHVPLADNEPCEDEDLKTTDETCLAGECLGLPDADEDGIADSGYGAACAGGETEGCNDNCADLANADQADADGNGVGDLCEAPAKPPCVTSEPKVSGQTCPLYMDCTEYADCGVFTECLQWYCSQGKCAVNAITNCWDDVGGSCIGDVSITQHINPPVDKDFLVPEGTGYREVTSLAFTITNSTGSDIYLDEVPLEFESNGGGTKWDLGILKMYKGSSQTEHGQGDMYLCMLDQPFMMSNNSMKSCSHSYFAKVAKWGGKTKFLITMVFDTDTTWIKDRSYRLRIPGTDGFVFRDSSIGGDIVNIGSICGVTPGGYDGAWGTAKDLGFTKCQNAVDCDDGNPCSSDVCAQGICQNAPLDGVDCDDENPDTVNDQCVLGTCEGMADSDKDGVVDSGYGETCAGGDTQECNDNCPAKANGNQADSDGDAVGNECDNCPDKANTDQTDSEGDGVGNECDNCPNHTNPDQADSDKNGVGDACEEPSGPACESNPPAGTGQKCPLLTPCSENTTCGVFKDCQQWYCYQGKCDLNTLSNCWDDLGGNCFANVVYQQHVNPPVDKDFLVPDGVDFRQVASVAFTITNYSTQDIYLDQLTFDLETANNGSKYDVTAVKLYDDSGGTEYGGGDSYICLQGDPFTWPANGTMDYCANWNSKIGKSGGSNRFIALLAFGAEMTWIEGRSYRLIIGGTDKFVFKNKSMGGEVVDPGSTCGFPSGGMKGAWVTAKKAD